MIIRTCLAVALYNKLTIKALMQTDLPEPVVPAINMCGIFAKSAITVPPLISLPRTSAREEFISSNSLDDKPSTNFTISRASLGISMPM